MIHYTIRYKFFRLTTEGINFTVKCREHPLTTTEAVVGEERKIGGQHEAIQDSKVGNEKVGWRSNFLHFKVKI